MNRSKIRTKRRTNGETMTLLEQLAIRISTQTEVLSKLNFLLQEEANIADGCLLWVVEYCAAHNIPIHEEKRFKNIMIDSKRIMQEIRDTSAILEKLCKITPSDESLQHYRNDEDFTAPTVAILKYPAIHLKTNLGIATKSEADYAQHETQLLGRKNNIPHPHLRKHDHNATGR